MRLIRPTSAEFLALFGPDVKDVWICSPWISTEGVEYLRQGIQCTNPTNLSNIEFWIRLNKKDYELGLSDYVSVATVIEELAVRAPKVNISIWCSDTLHAKCFFTDRGALLGSCNLTRAGFESNLELAIRLEPSEILGQLSLRDVLRSTLRLINKKEWQDFVHDLSKSSQLPAAIVFDKEGSWESFVQGLLAEGPPHPKTHLR